MVVLNNGITKNVGDPILESEIELMFVWVPRYEYKLPANSLGTTDSPEAIDIKFIDASVTTASNEYSLHPGFTFDGENKNGIWFGKFESSTTGDVTTNAVQKIIIKPNVISWRNVDPANSHLSSLNIVTTDYNLSGVESRMARYLEWTTAFYLANSIYGRCSNSVTCVEVSRNNSSNYYTGRSDGSNGIGTEVVAIGTYTYETESGVLASTTGNIYGIYDMSGGASEHVLAFAADEAGTVYLGGQSATKFSGFNGAYGNGNGSNTKGVEVEEKYYDVFTLTDMNTQNYSVVSMVNGSSSMNGVYKELMTDYTLSTTWYGDSVQTLYSLEPIFVMGGLYAGTAGTGIFYSVRTNSSPYELYSFRVVMTSD